MLTEFLEATQGHAKEPRASTVGPMAEELAGRGAAYGQLARCTAALYQGDETAKEELWALRDEWSSLGGSTEQRGVLLEAVKGPVVCGEPK